MGAMDVLRIPDDPVALRWLTLRRWALAFTVAAFPLIFILDAAFDPAVSPVLPGLVTLLVIWLAAPFIFMELWQRVSDAESRRARKYEYTSRFVLGAAFLWFALWLVFA